MIARLRDNATVADIIAELYFRQKVDQGLGQLDAGQVILNEGAKERLAKWLN